MKEPVLIAIYIAMFLAFFVAAGTIDRAEEERQSLAGYVTERE